MKHSDIIKPTIFLYSTLVLATSVITSKPISDNLFKWMSSLASIVILLWLMYEKWAWKWRIFDKISYYYLGSPVIHGTWKGKLAYESDQYGKQGEVDIYMSVRQTLTTVNITTFFSRPSESYSIVSTIEKTLSGKYKLFYIYRSEAPYGKRDENRPHEGTAIINIVGEPVKELIGSYFTERKGAGSIKLSQHTDKIADTLDSAQALFNSDTIN